MAARDRLAGRGQPNPQAQPYGGYGDSSYPPPTAPYGDGGMGYGGLGAQSSPSPGRGYQQMQDNSYPMSQRGGEVDMNAFYNEITAIQEEIKHFNENVQGINNLHQRSLNNMDEVQTQRIEADLDNLVQDTRAQSGAIKARIQKLVNQGFNGRDGQIRSQQTEFVKSKFTEAVQNYQDIEKQYRSKYKARMERQFRIVKPDASPEEVRAVVNDEQGGQIFAQALMNSNRYGESKAAYREVQDRHRDIQKIERTISELAQLFSDMSNMVVEQDDTLKVIEHNAQAVNVDTEQGMKHTDAAAVSAAGARKKRWICFFICLVILIIIAVVVAIEVTKNLPKKSTTNTVNNTVTVTNRRRIALPTAAAIL